MKTILVTITVAVLAGILIGRAEEISLVTNSGRKIEKADLSRIEPDGLVLVTSEGIEKIPFAELSVDLQRKFGFNPKTAADYSFAVGLAQKQNAIRAQAQTAEGASPSPAKAAKANSHKAAEVTPGPAVRTIRGEITGRNVEGVFVSVTIPPSEEAIEKYRERQFRDDLTYGPMHGNNVGQGGGAGSGLSTKKQTVFISNFHDSFAKTVNLKVIDGGARVIDGRELPTYIAQ